MFQISLVSNQDGGGGSGVVPELTQSMGHVAVRCSLGDIIHNHRPERFAVVTGRSICEFGWLKHTFL